MFTIRPWELTPMVVDNYVEGIGQLVFYLRGGKVQKITSSTWLQDQTRFSYDGFRRQRLTTPLVRGYSVTWPAAVAVWLGRVSNKRFVFRVDPVSSFSFFNWLTLYNGVVHPSGTSTVVAVDVNLQGTHVYHGVFGLVGATAAAVAFPSGLPYEELGILRGPTKSLLEIPKGVAQLFSTCFKYRCCTYGHPAHELPRVFTCALFQVSPLQHLLGEW